MAQSVERYLGKVEVVGSSPISSFGVPIFGTLFLFLTGGDLCVVEKIFVRKGLLSCPIVLV